MNGGLLIKMTKRRLLALDQATSTTGYSLWEDGQLVKYGKVKFEGSAIERVVQARQWLEKVVKMLKEDGYELEVVLEDIQLQHGDVVTFKTLAWVQGVLYAYLTECGIKTTLYFASEWKKSCGVKGKDRGAQKRSAQAYVLNTYGIKATQDECDAICIGAHHITEGNKVVSWD